MKKVLIVDDSAFLRNSLKEIFSKRFSKGDALQVVEASNRETALQTFVRESPDLVLLDIVMREGEREGVSVLKEIRESLKKSTPVVVLSSVGQESIVQECEKLGIKGYILKPFDEDEIIKTVEKCLA